MKHLTAICFDLFNTLVSVGDVSDQVGRFTADVLGVDHEVWNEACFGPHHDICSPTMHLDVLRNLAHSIDKSIPEETIKLAADERQRRFDHALINAEETVINELIYLRKSGIKLALISNASTGEVSAWQDSPLSDIFDVSVFSCECGYQKPDVRIYQHTISELATAADECLYVGDGGSQEFVGAHEVGMHTVVTRQFLKPGRYEKVKKQQGDRIRSEIQHISELQQRFIK